jgi:hypothetical protein
MRRAALALILALAACAAPPRDDSRTSPHVTGVTIGGSVGGFWGVAR